MLFQNITILDKNFEIKENQYVAIKDGIIEYIGKTKPEGKYGRTYDGKGKLLMSGFYNAHAHSPMTLMRGYGENLSLDKWLNTRIFPFEDKLNSNAVYYGTLLAIAESLRFGIVSSSDMYYFCEDMIRAYLDSGAKGNISRSIVSFDSTPAKEMISFREMETLVDTFQRAGNGKIIIDASLHAEYTNRTHCIEEVSSYAKAKGLIMHVHVSETKSEHEAGKARHNGLTPTQLMARCGAFDVPAIAAHGIWLEPEDMDIMKEKKVTVASCPISNLKLSSGICNVPELMKRGVNVAIGTDSVASNNSLNFIEEIKFFALLNKERRQDPTIITPQESLFAATAAGARAQGRQDCGILAPGNKADLIVLDMNKPYMHPVHDLATNLVYSASGTDVVLTMIDGKVCYEQGEFLTIDLEKAIYETEKACKIILEQL